MKMLQTAVFAAYTVVLLQPFDVPDPLGIGPDRSWTFVCLTAALLILIAEWRRNGWPATRGNWVLMLYVVTALLTTITSVDRTQTVIWLLALAGQVGIFAATVSLARRHPALTRWWLVTFVVAVCLLLLLATEYHAEVGFLTRPKLYPSPEGWTGYPQLGTLAALQLAVLVAVLVTERRPFLLVCATVLLVVCLIELALLYSRGSWLAAGVGLIAVPTVLSTWKQARRTLVAATVLCLLAASAVAWNPMLRRLALGDTTADLRGYTLELASPEMRFDLYKRAVRMSRDYAMTGVGLGNFQRVFESVYNPEINNDGRRGVHAHNLWLQAYGELGVFGGTAFLALWIVMLATAWRSARQRQDLESIGVFAMLIVLAGTNLTTNMFFVPGLVSGRLHSLQWILFGLAMAPTHHGQMMKSRREIVRDGYRTGAARSSPSGAPGETNGVWTIPSGPAERTHTVPADGSAATFTR
jgi:O-antigen ligase